MKEVLFLIILFVVYSFASDTRTQSQDRATPVSKSRRDSTYLIQYQIKAAKDSSGMLTDSIKTLLDVKGTTIAQGIKDDQKHKDRVKEKIVLLNEKLDTVRAVPKDTTVIEVVQKVVLVDTVARPMVITISHPAPEKPKKHWLRKLFNR